MCYVEYSEARNREEHPAQIKLTDQRRGAVTRGSALALQHGGRVPGIQLVEVQCQIPSLCRLPKPSTPSSLSKALTAIPLFQFCRGAINHILLSADSSAH